MEPGVGADDARVGPYSSLLGFAVVEITDEHVVIEGTPQAEHLNGGGIVHGGYLSSLLDTTSGWAAHRGSGGVVPHTHMSVQFVRAGVAGVPMRCTGRCVRAGRSVAAAEAEIVQDGRVIARAVTTHAVLRPGE